MNIYPTEKYRHKKYTVKAFWNEKLTVHYFVCSIPNIGYQIHEHMPWNETGYGNSFLDFLMDDGTIEKVKGPYFKYPPHDHLFAWFEKNGINLTEIDHKDLTK